MTTARIAFACVLISSILFSCNNKKEKTITKGTGEQAILYDTVTASVSEIFNISQYNTGFNNAATQQFSVSAKRISIVKASKGLSVVVNPSALEKEDGSPVDGKISVSIIELTNSNELFRSNAATESDGRLLASGGSYFIGMECNGRKLRIKSGQNHAG